MPLNATSWSRSQMASREWYLKNRPQILARLRLQYQEHHDSALAQVKQRQATPKYRAQEQIRRERPESRRKQRARSAAYRALRNGLLVRQPCETCGSFEAQMHHDDYDQPLVVRWLCRRDHFQQEHRLT